MFGHFANWGKYLFLRGSNFAVVQELNTEHILLTKFHVSSTLLVS